jgi:SpoIVB peptidase S55
MHWMRRPRAVLVAVAATCTLAAGVSRAAPESPYLPPDQIRPGMMGVGRTVFQGHVPEEFQVEFLGVLKNAIGPGQDMILSRLHGKNVERTGVIAGMSGSPVTVDGKVVGAISYRLGAFEKEAIAGITPIADMLKAADLNPRPRRSGTASGEDLLARWSGSSESAPVPTGFPGPAGEMVPIATPLVFSGFPEPVVRQVSPLFRSLGLEPVQGGGGTGSSGADYPVEPGVPVAVALISGDLSLAATGTLTHVEGDRVWAFGHPFLDTGSVRYPMLRSEILITYPSAMGSFKISNATSPIGTLLEDRLTSIQGVLGPVPPSIPVSVLLATPAGERRLSYELVQDRVLTPLLLGVATQASLQRVLEYSAESTFRSELTVETEGHPPLLFASVDTDPGGPQSGVAASVSRDVAAVFNAIYSNRFEEPKVRSVRLKVDSIPEARLAKVGEVSVTPSPVRPGDRLTVRVSVQPYRGDSFIREFQAKVPPDTPRGPLVVTVASARALNSAEGNLLQRRFVGVAGLDEMIRFLNTLRSDDALYLQLARRSLGAVVQGQTLPSLPLSVIFTLGSSRYLAEEYPAPDLPVAEDFQKTDFVLTGGRRTTIQVR